MLVLAEATPATMTAILTDVSTVATSIITLMGQFVTFITSNPLVLLPIIVSIVGLGVNFLVRFLKTI